MNEKWIKIQAESEERKIGRGYIKELRRGRGECQRGNVKEKSVKSASLSSVEQLGINTCLRYEQYVKCFYSS